MEKEKKKRKSIEFIEKNESLSNFDMNLLKGGIKDPNNCQVDCDASAQCNVKAASKNFTGIHAH